MFSVSGSISNLDNDYLLISETFYYVGCVDIQNNKRDLIKNPEYKRKLLVIGKEAAARYLAEQQGDMPLSEIEKKYRENGAAPKWKVPSDCPRSHPVRIWHDAHMAAMKAMERHLKETLDLNVGIGCVMLKTAKGERHDQATAQRGCY